MSVILGAPTNVERFVSKRQQQPISLETFLTLQPDLKILIGAEALTPKDCWENGETKAVHAERILSRAQNPQSKTENAWSVLAPSIEAQTLFAFSIGQRLALNATTSDEKKTFLKIIDKVSARVRQASPTSYMPLLRPCFDLCTVDIKDNPFPDLFDSISGRLDLEGQAFALFLVNSSPLIRFISSPVLPEKVKKRLTQTSNNVFDAINRSLNFDDLTVEDIRLYVAASRLHGYGYDMQGIRLNFAEVAIQKLHGFKMLARDKAKESDYLALHAKALPDALPIVRNDILAIVPGNISFGKIYKSPPLLEDFLKEAIANAQGGNEESKELLSDFVLTSQSPRGAVINLDFIDNMIRNPIFSSAEIGFVVRNFYANHKIILTITDEEILDLFKGKTVLKIDSRVGIYLIYPDGTEKIAGYFIAEESHNGHEPTTATNEVVIYEMPNTERPAADTQEANGQSTEETNPGIQTDNQVAGHNVEIQEVSILDKVRRILGQSLLEDYEDEYGEIEKIDDEWNRIDHDRTNRFPILGSSCTLDKDGLKKAGPNTYPRIDFFHGEAGAIINTETCSDIRGTLWLDDSIPLPFALTENGWLVDRGDSDFLMGLSTSEETMPLFLALNARICMQARKLLVQSDEQMKKNSMAVFLRRVFDSEEGEQKDPDGKYRRKTVSVRVENGITVIDHGIVKSFVLNTDNTSPDYEERKLTVEKASKMLKDDPGLEFVSESRLVSPEEYLGIRKKAKRRGALKELSDEKPNKGGPRWLGFNSNFVPYLPSLEILEYLEKYEPHVRLRIRTIFFYVGDELKELTMYSTYVRPRGQKTEKEIYDRSSVREPELAAV